MRIIIAQLLLLTACGRTPFDDEPKTGAIEAPLFVFTGRQCPTTGTEADLTLREPSEDLALVRFRAAGECSGVGGEWFIGREVGSTRGLFIGAHGCFFFPQTLRDSNEGRFGVVRFNQTAAIFHTPTGWCLTDEDGVDPASTDASIHAWGVYGSEAAARAAYERLRERD